MKYTPVPNDQYTDKMAKRDKRVIKKAMENTTQNKYKTMDDYEKELKKKGIYTKPKIKRDKAEDIVFGWMFECDRSLDKQSRKMLTDEIRLALADARKEVMDKVGDMKTDKMLKSYWSESVTSSSYAGGYLQAIDDVLATLKEEESK